MRRDHGAPSLRCSGRQRHQVGERLANARARFDEQRLAALQGERHLARHRRLFAARRPLVAVDGAESFGVTEPGVDPVGIARAGTRRAIRTRRRRLDSSDRLHGREGNLLEVVEQRGQRGMPERQVASHGVTKRLVQLPVPADTLDEAARSLAQRGLDRDAVLVVVRGGRPRLPGVEKAPQGAPADQQAAAAKLAALAAGPGDEHGARPERGVMIGIADLMHAYGAGQVERQPDRAAGPAPGQCAEQCAFRRSPGHRHRFRRVRSPAGGA
ncbi:MAG: hypothetical protein IPO18_13160 [bacterium]|nr:hypothetical protein [bacterium]